MTSDQIKLMPHADFSTNQWLKEIAYQLALRNEKKAELTQQNFNQPRKFK